MRIPKSLRFAFNVSGDGDTYANVQAWRFAVAELIYHTVNGVPEAWGYKHSDVWPCNYVAEDLTFQWLLVLWDGANKRFNPDREPWHLAELTHYGNVLNRYAAILEAQGKSY